VILELNVPSFRLEQASKDRSSQDLDASSWVRKKLKAEF